MNFEEATVDQDASFAYFVYPFLFDPKEFETRVSAIEQATLPERKVEKNKLAKAIKPSAIEQAQLSERKGEHRVWDEQQFPQDDLLSHVAKYLNPNGSALSTARLWKISGAFRDNFGLRAEWRLLSPLGKILFQLGVDGQGSKAVQLVLFRIGVGFLTVQAQPVSGVVSDWLDFIHSFRFVRGQRGIKVQARKRIFDQSTGQAQYVDFFPTPTRSVAQHPEGIGLFDELLTALLETGAMKGDSQPWWREVFVPGQMLPFTALFADGLPEKKQPHLLYKLRNFFNTAQGDHPALCDLQPEHPALLPYVEKQWFAMSLEGGVFLAGDAPKTDFFRQTLPNHLQNEYFLLFLLALHQRFTLMMLSEKVAHNWGVADKTNCDKEREKVFQEIRDQLLLFTARGYFAQTMQREHHHRCYLKWQEVFQIERLYQEVGDEVREMHEYSMMRQSQRVEERINLVGAFIGIPALIIGFLGINLQGITSNDGMALWLALLIGLGGGIGLSLLVWRWLKQS